MDNLSIENWKLFLALQDASEYMWDYGHRLNPHYHDPLIKVMEGALDPGFVLNFYDPAVKVFLQLIESSPDPFELSLSSLIMRMRLWAELSKNSGIHCFDAAGLSDQLLAARRNSGWTHLDAMLKVLCGVSLTKFFDGVEAIYLQNEPGQGGDVCYRLKIGTGSYEDFQWFAVASTLGGIIELFSQALDSDRLDSYLASGGGSHPKVTAAVLRNDISLFSVELATGETRGPLWRTIHLEGNDLSLIKALAGLAPKQAILLLKGRILESDLGF